MSTEPERQGGDQDAAGDADAAEGGSDLRFAGPGGEVFRVTPSGDLIVEGSGTELAEAVKAAGLDASAAGDESAAAEAVAAGPGDGESVPAEGTIEAGSEAVPAAAPPLGVIPESSGPLTEQQARTAELLRSLLSELNFGFRESLEETPYNRYLRFAGPSGERFLVNADGTLEVIGVEPWLARHITGAGFDLRRVRLQTAVARRDSTGAGARTATPPPQVGPPVVQPTVAGHEPKVEVDPQEEALKALRRFLVDQDVEFTEIPPGPGYGGNWRIDGPAGERFLVTTAGAIVIRGEASALSKSVKSAGLVAGGKSVRVLVETGRWTPGQRHIPLGLGILIRLGVLWAFTLPFVSASCSGEESRPMSGYQLLRGEEPEWLPSVPSETTEEDREKVRSALQEYRDPARVVFVLTVAALIASMVFFILPRASVGAWFLLLLTVVSLAGLVGLLPVPFDVDFFSSEPEVHHHAGVGVLSALVAIGSVTDVWSVKASLRDAGLGDPLTAWTLGCVSVLLLPLVFLLVYAIFASV